VRRRTRALGALLVALALPGCAGPAAPAASTVSPAGANPANASPANANPANVGPAGANPANASPAGASPAGANPAGASPAGASPAGVGPAGGRAAAAAGFNDVDVMFLQMGLAQIKEGDQVAALAEQRAGDGEIRAVATELRGQWRTESATMQRWLLGWQQPLIADPAAGAHAGHGDLHVLRPTDIAELRAARGATFDRTALGLLLGHLHNCVETTRMESGGGQYPPAINLATAMTAARQSQVRRLLILSAKPLA